MIDWTKTEQGLPAIVAAIFSTMVACWNLGMPRLVFPPELAPIDARRLSRPSRYAKLSDPNGGHSAGQFL
jgi:hypothetical protein